MSTTNFNITGIIWNSDDASLPSNVLVPVPSYMADRGPEEYEGDDFYEAVEEMDEEEAEDFWDNYEPRDAAGAAFDKAWDEGMKELLRARFGVAPAVVGSWQPAND